VTTERTPVCARRSIEEQRQLTKLRRGGQLSAFWLREK